MGHDPEREFPHGDWTRELVRRALAEDVGSGDASTAVSVDAATVGRGRIVSRETGVVAGLPLVEMVYGELDGGVTVEVLLPDGSAVEPGSQVAVISGPAAALLTGERCALNFLQHLGGVASLTARFVAAVAGTGCRVLDTRKTLPGYRALAKYAVLCGGGHNHRMGLYDRIMLKDNHWAAAEGGIAAMVARARGGYPELAVEVEVDDLAQLEEVLPLQVEWILLDNFTVEDTRTAVRLRNAAGSSTQLESSGNINLDSIGEYARAGVDGASVGRLTHSAGALDLGLDLESR